MNTNAHLSKTVLSGILGTIGMTLFMMMGNFMVLNLFLALLLNSFNSEELKSRKEVS